MIKFLLIFVLISSVSMRKIEAELMMIPSFQSSGPYLEEQLILLSFIIVSAGTLITSWILMQILVFLYYVFFVLLKMI